MDCSGEVYNKRPGHQNNLQRSRLGAEGLPASPLAKIKEGRLKGRRLCPPDCFTKEEQGNPLLYLTNCYLFNSLCRGKHLCAYM